MADSKNPPVLPEGYDPELEKANKGMAAFEAEKNKEGMEAQKKRDKAKALMDFGLGILKDVKEPAKKMAKGGSVGSASKRADGIATKGKTRGKIV